MEEVRKIIREIIKETIRKIGDKYVVYPEKGGKRLGTHSTKAAAEKQLQAIHIQQHNEMLNYPNWLRNTAQTPQNNPDGEHRFYLPKKKKIKEFAMGMMSPVEKARHQRNMHKLMKILNKRQVQYFEYPNIPNTLVRKLYEKEQIPGGLAKGMSLVDIAKKHKVKLGSLRQELNLGIKTELEHTTSKSVAREIAMDHLFEDPKYYTKIQKANL
jgi:hypothetical protein